MAPVSHVRGSGASARLPRGQQPIWSRSRNRSWYVVILRTTNFGAGRQRPCRSDRRGRRRSPGPQSVPRHPDCHAGDFRAGAWPGNTLSRPVDRAFPGAARMSWAHRASRRKTTLRLLRGSNTEFLLSESASSV